MAPLPVTDADIRERTTGGSYDRGREYVNDGAVQSLEQVGPGTIKAVVQGTDVHPYVVQIEYDEDDVTAVECSCPYVEGSWCKHIAAALLKALASKSIPKTEPVAVAEVVRDLDRSALVALLQRLAEDDPDLVERIEETSTHLLKDAGRT